MTTHKLNRRINAALAINRAHAYRIYPKGARPETKLLRLAWIFDELRRVLDICDEAQP